MGHDGELERDRPEAIIVRSRPQLGADYSSNQLIIDVEPPSRDTPEGWKELPMQTCDRVLQYDNGPYDIYIICAVGLNCIALYWNPRNADYPSTRLAT
jgi:hypothetical protein